MSTASAPTANMIPSRVEVDQMVDLQREMVALVEDLMEVHPTEMAPVAEEMVMEEPREIMEGEEANHPPTVNMNNRSRMERYQEQLAKTIPTILSNNWRRKGLQASSLHLLTRL